MNFYLIASIVVQILLRSVKQGRWPSLKSSLKPVLMVSLQMILD